VDTTTALLDRSKELLADFNIDDHPLVGVLPFPPASQLTRSTHSFFHVRLALQTKFTTGDDDHVGDDYFLTSGDKIRFFLERDALDQGGRLTRPKEKAVNKIGHGQCAQAYHVIFADVLGWRNRGLAN